jgi:hypothetical protein
MLFWEDTVCVEIIVRPVSHVLIGGASGLMISELNMSASGERTTRTQS